VLAGGGITDGYVVKEIREDVQEVREDVIDVIYYK
jgi:hypothetical protein